MTNRGDDSARGQRAYDAALKPCGSVACFLDDQYEAAPESCGM